MTYVEFFDKTATENVCSCLAAFPERVILIGDKMNQLKAHAERYKKLFLGRGHEVEFVLRSLTRNNLGSVVESLSYIVETYDDCVFDLTGGSDLYLVAVGIIAERYSEKNIQMHRFNITAGTVVDCDKDGNLIAGGDFPEMSVEENILIYGGRVVYESDEPGATVRWDLTEDFTKDIDTMWEICRDDVRKWNTQIGVLEGIDMIGQESEDGLTVSASLGRLKDYLKRHRGKFVELRDILGRLSRAGLITDYTNNEETVTVSYKNGQIRRCLTKAGQALEMKVYSAAKNIQDDDGEPWYNDVMNGVSIDWDGVVDGDDDTPDTENEIDVLMMKGCVPVFVSCKNGVVEMEELYKLNSVATRFGGKYAKKAIVVSAIDSLGTRAPYFLQRAADMDIRVLKDPQKLSDKELARELKCLWSN